MVRLILAATKATQEEILELCCLVRGTKVSVADRVRARIVSASAGRDVQDGGSENDWMQSGICL